MTETQNQGGMPDPGSTPPPGPSGGFDARRLTDLGRLRRSRTDRKVAGVAGGLGRHLDIDPTILRVLFVVLALFGGAGILVYVVAWLLVPEEHTDSTLVTTSDSLRNALLIGAGVVALLVALGQGWWGGFPWLLVAGVILVAVLLSRDGETRAARRAGWTPPRAYPPTYPPTYAEQAAYAAQAPTAGGWVGDAGQTTGQTGTYPGYSGPYSGPYAGPYADPADPTGTQSVPPTPPSWYPPTPPPPLPPRRPRRTGPILFGMALAAIALALGILGMVDASGTSVPDAAYPALALAVTGAMLVLGAFWGRPGGLILLGLVAAMATLAAGIAEPRFTGDRNQVFHPVSAAQVQDSYSVPAGRIELDLTRVSEVAALDGRDISLEGNAGELLVIVPDDVQVVVDSSIDFGGQIDLPNRSQDGWGPELAETVPARDGDAAATIHLDLQLQAGHIEVRQQ